jgi:hypothetical protein
MVEKKPEDEGVIFSGKCLNDSYKGKEFEGYLKFKPPAKKPEIKRSIYDSVWVWFLLCLGIGGRSDRFYQYQPRWRLLSRSGYLSISKTSTFGLQSY